MIYTSDKKEKCANNYAVSLIPCSKNEEANGLYVTSFNELSYEKAPDYKEMSYDEIREYITEYYNNVLSKLDPEAVLDELRYSVLISDERCDSLAIRHIVSEWISLYTDERVIETGIDDEGKFYKVDRPDFIRPMLEEAIKNSKETMRGFQSLRGLYLYEKGEKLDAKANMLEEKTGEDYSNLRQAACFLRCEADIAEEKYNNKKVYTKSYSARKKYNRTFKLSD